MKKSIFLLFIVGLLFTACQQVTTSTSGTTAISKPIDLTNKRVLFLGNSITHNGLYVSFIEYALRKANPKELIDLISIGLGSETVSCLSEPSHPFPRPCVLDRLDSALALTQPEVIIACYGMNDGIYHPPAGDRLNAYKNGIQQLIQKAKKINAELILFTPTPFDVLPIKDKIVSLDASDFGYTTPYEGYDMVLKEYTDWLNTLDKKIVKVIDWHTAINETIARKRVNDPTFTYAKDGIHPNEAGHLLMAQLFLKGLALTEEKEQIVDNQKIKSDALFLKTHKNRANRSERWRNYIGYTRGKTVQSISPKSLLILMGGQSNMTGLAKKNNLENTTLPNNVHFVDYGLTGSLKTMPNHFGPEYSISRQLHQVFPDQHFTLLKYSIGGASLLDWAPEYSTKKAEITGNAKFGNVYAKCFSKVDSLMAIDEVQPTAFLWMQGERDARIPAAGKDYYQNFKHFIESIREQLEQPNLPFIFGMVNPPKERYAALATVRAAQRKIARDLPNVFIIETDDLEKLKDNLHYNAAGQLEMGKRFGKQLITLLRPTLND